MPEPTISPDATQPLQLPRLNPWRELAYLSIYVMEICWVVPVYTWLASPTGPAVPLRSILAFGVTLIVANLSLRALNIFEIKKDLRRWVFGILLFVSILFSLKLLVYPSGSVAPWAIFRSVLAAFNATNPRLPTEFIVILLVIVMSYRGAVLAGRSLAPYVVAGSLRLGLLALILVGLAAAITGHAIPGNISYLLVFLFAGLLGMTATRITVMGQLRGGQKIAFDRQRVTGLVAAILSLVLLAGSVGALIGSPGGTKLINAGFALVIWLARWLLIAGGFLLYPLIVAFFSLVQWVLSRLSLHPVKLTMNQQMDEILKQLQDLSARQRAFPFNIHILQPLILAELILLAAAAAILLIRDRIARDKAASLGETEALLSPDELLRQMLLSARKNAQSLLNGLAQRLGLGRIARQLAAQRIRAIYTELLDLATQLKYPRCPHQTPLEYLPELQKAFPGSQTELDLITQAYQRIRYGEFPESQAEVNAIESAWRQVQSEGQKILIELRT